MKDLDTNTKIALMKRIDDFVESERANQPGVPDTTLMMPELNRIAEEYALDVSDKVILGCRLIPYKKIARCQ